MKISLDGVPKNFPDFLIVGALKCGTTSLHHYLAKHPQVFMPKPKELHFWHQNRNPNRAIFNYSLSVATNLLSYLGWFADAKESQIVGESCGTYLYYHDLVIQSLKEFHPQWEKVKIVIILRDPLERIFSQYRSARQRGHDPEKLSFASSIREESRRKADPQLLTVLHYLSVSLYSQQLKAYLDTFQSVKVLLYEDLAKDPGSLMLDLCAFLGVDQDSANAMDYSKKHNVTKAARLGRFSGASSTYEVLRGWGRLFPSSLRWPVRKVLDVVFRADEPLEPFDPATIQDLKQKLRPDVRKVEELIGRDLSCWTTVMDESFPVSQNRGNSMVVPGHKQKKFR